MIDSFTDRFRFLSNFSPDPVRTPLRSDRPAHFTMPTAEHAFQAEKAVSAADFMSIYRADTPAEAKRIGRHIAIRPDWERVKKRVMLEVLISKFSDPKLKGRLLSTGRELLIEGNDWSDTFWGCVPSERRPDLVMLLWGPKKQWAGENWLGRLLMMTRDVYR